MTDTASPPAERMPIPLGVIAETGDTRPPLTEDVLQHITPDSDVTRARSEVPRGRALDATVDDPNDLAEVGWCVVFPSAVDPAIVEALEPLIALRRGQVDDDLLFKVFSGPTGVRPGQSAQNWAASRNVSLTAPVSARKGVPYYMLLVGSPLEIPFEFQALLDLQWAVGRVYFDDVAGYAEYARRVVEYETGEARPQRRQATVWMPRNPLDMATAMLAGSLIPELKGEVTPGDRPVGRKQKFELTTFVGDAQATKTCLTDILRGQAAGGAPSVLFTGSHGAEWSIDTPEVQRERQGALVTQEWTRGRPLGPDEYFSAEDIPADADVHGLMMFLFACFGGGCPNLDSYYFKPDGSNVALAREPMIAQLPQALLRRGALAVIAHVDRAFSYAFEDAAGTPQAQLLRAPIELLMKGRRVGLAADPLNLQWSALAAQLGAALGGNAPGAPPPRPPALANLFIARDDAKNYVVLGDPAARLRVEMMN